MDQMLPSEGDGAHLSTPGVEREFDDEDARV